MGSGGSGGAGQACELGAAGQLPHAGITPASQGRAFQHGLYPGVFTAEREKGGRARSVSANATSSPEESGLFGCLFKSQLKFRQISHCPFKTKTNSFQKIV